MEDVSEEACTGRHDRSEVEERKKFMSYLKQPPGASRGRRRVDHVSDSRAESSGANTPTDPMSPHDGSKCESGSLLLDAVDPETDLSMETKDNVDVQQQQQQQQMLGAVSSIKERRRTASLTKKAENIWRFINDDNSAMSWEMDEVIYHTSATYSLLFD